MVLKGVGGAVEFCGSERDQQEWKEENREKTHLERRQRVRKSVVETVVFDEGADERVEVVLREVVGEESRNLTSPVGGEGPLEDDEAVRVSRSDIVSVEVVLEEAPRFRGQRAVPCRRLVRLCDPSRILRSAGKGG